MSEWIKGSTSQGKFPEKAFNAVLTAIYPGTVGEKDIPALKLDFEGDTQLAIFGIGKLENGIAPGFMGLGKFLDSLTALGIEYFWAMEQGEPVGFKTEPDIVGSRLYMKPTESKQVGEGQRVFLDWIVSRIHQIEKPQPTATAPTQETEDMTESWKELLIDLPEPTTEVGIMRHVKATVKDEKQRKALMDVRKDTLKKLVDEGFLNLENGKYEVVV